MNPKKLSGTYVILKCLTQRFSTRGPCTTSGLWPSAWWSTSNS